MTNQQDLRSRIAEIVFETIGYASLCWNPQPTGVFDSSKAKTAGEKLIDQILAITEQASCESKPQMMSEEEIKKIIQEYIDNDQLEDWIANELTHALAEAMNGK